MAFLQVCLSLLPFFALFFFPRSSHPYSINHLFLYNTFLFGVRGSASESRADWWIIFPSFEHRMFSVLSRPQTTTSPLLGPTIYETLCRLTRFTLPLVQRRAPKVVAGALIVMTKHFGFFSLLGCPLNLRLKVPKRVPTPTSASTKFQGLADFKLPITCNIGHSPPPGHSPGRLTSLPPVP
jgi:hypothetical protein